MVVNLGKFCLSSYPNIHVQIFQVGSLIFQNILEAFSGTKWTVLDQNWGTNGSSWTFVGMFHIFEQRNKKTAQRLPSALIALITFHSVRSACLSQLQDLRFASYKEGQKFFVILIFSLPLKFSRGEGGWKQSLSLYFDTILASSASFLKMNRVSVRRTEGFFSFLPCIVRCGQGRV